LTEIRSVFYLSLSSVVRHQRDRRGEKEKEGLALYPFSWRVLSNFGVEGYRGYIAVAVSKLDFLGREAKILFFVLVSSAIFEAQNLLKKIYSRKTLLPGYGIQLVSISIGDFHHIMSNTNAL
jgi:hypothetical protein